MCISVSRKGFVNTVFKKLKDPAIMKAIAKVTTLKQAATIGNVSIGEMINQLRDTVGMDNLDLQSSKSGNQKEKPEWIDKNKIKFEYDASIDLENGIHPVAKVTKEILELGEGELYLLVTPFVPATLLQIVEEKGFETFSEQAGDQRFNTYIKKK